MKIQDAIQETCIGTTVHFSNADLIVLKEAFQPIQDHLGSEECIRTEAEGKPTLTSVPMKNIFMIQVFIEHLTKGVKNLDEVRDTLFSRDLDTKTGLIPEGLVQARDSEQGQVDTVFHVLHVDALGKPIDESFFISGSDLKSEWDLDDEDIGFIANGGAAVLDNRTRLVSQKIHVTN